LIVREEMTGFNEPRWVWFPVQGFRHTVIFLDKESCRAKAHEFLLECQQDCLRSGIYEIAYFVRCGWCRSTISPDSRGSARCLLAGVPNTNAFIHLTSLVRAIRRQRTWLVRLVGGGLWRVRGPTSSVRNRKWTYLSNRPDDVKSLPSRRKTHLNRRGHPLGLPG